MVKRFGAAVFTALVLHAALIGLAVLRHSEAPRELDTSELDSAVEVELSMLTADDAPSASPIDEPSEDKVQRQARVAQLGGLPQRSGRAPIAEAELDPGGEPAADAALGPSADAEGSGDGAPEQGSVRPRVDLGLDGSVMRRAALDARERPPRTPRRRQVFSLGHWSENTVRSVAQRSAPWEGRALLTLEWDAKGQLLSVTSSAASSNGEEWQRLAKGIGSQLAARPNVGAQGKGLRVVYLVKSELGLPESKRSVLPDAKYASAEQLRENNLPPATAINFGVKADGSAATTRVVSVELVRSDAL